MVNKKQTYRAARVQKAVLKTVEKLEAHLEKPANQAEYVHRIRVDIKRLRGWLRILRIQNKEQDWKITDQRLHEIAKSLGGFRDSEVIRETLALLDEGVNNEQEQQMVTLLREKYLTGNTKPNIDWQTIKKSLLHELAIYKKEFIYFKNIGVVKKGLQRLYKRTLKHGKRAFSNDGSFSDLHKLRKWIKYLNYQLAYVRAAYPDSMDKFKKGINKLGDQLGKIHDLYMLKEQVLADPTLKEEQVFIERLIERFLYKSEQSYHQLFNLSPDDFTKQIH